MHSGTITLDGRKVFDRVCLTGGGVLATDKGLQLLAGVLYVEGGSGISGDPPESGATGCNQNGEDGADLDISARQATVFGLISANGGRGADPYADSCDSASPGGAGGHITLRAYSLALTGRISADGGSSTDAAGHTRGGSGGTITIHVAVPALAALGGSESVAAGGPGGKKGQVSIAPLTPAEQAALPPAPPPLLATLGQAPARLAPLPVAAFARGMACGPGDLDIGAGQRRRLDGVRAYAHVCVHDGGLLRAGPRLILRAQTVLVDARARASAPMAW